MELNFIEKEKSYQITLDIFQGPLDLLLFLIRKKKININDIPIASITKEYLHYLEKKDRINLEREAEFLLMAAFLIYLKSQVLLPRTKEIEEDEDPRQQLVEKLLDYQKIKTASRVLKEKETGQLKIWQRTTLPRASAEKELDLSEISLFDLAESFFSLIQRKNLDSIPVLEGKKYSIEQKMKDIIHLLQVHTYLDFDTYFQSQNSLEEALTAFFSLLELIKNRTVAAIQKSLFQPIQVWLRQKSEQ